MFTNPYLQGFLRTLSALVKDGSLLGVCGDPFIGTTVRFMVIFGTLKDHCVEGFLR